MIFKRLMVMTGIVLALAACGTTGESDNGETGSNDSGAATPTVEVLDTTDDEAQSASDEPAAYEYTLDAVYDIPATWSGRAQFRYPSDWRIRDTNQGDLVGDFTLYAPDNYVINLSVNGDPQNDADRMEDILDTLNQFAEIETLEVDGKTVLISETRGGNAITATTILDDNKIVFAELLSTRGGELEPMVDTVLDILVSFEPLPQDEE